MEDKPPCPVCGVSSWESIESYSYSRTDRATSLSPALVLRWRQLRWVVRTLVFTRPRRRTATCRRLTPYEAKRREVLWSVWQPEATTFVLRTAYCLSCGFVTYLPRPTPHEVRAKYSYLTTVDPDVGGESNLGPSGRKADQRRAARVYATCMSHLRPSPTEQPLPALDILDYGGGNGKLLRPFLAQGHRCYLIDYNPHPIPGVMRIGEDFATCVDDRRFDLIICSHVLEHVADPGLLIDFLRQRLADSGLLYVEVPQEIWAGLRLEIDPVTHVNFFTLPSLGRLLRDRGLRILEQKQQIANYGDAATEVIWAIATHDGTRNAAATAGVTPGEPCAQGEVVPEGVEYVKRLLYPSRRATLDRLRRLSDKGIAD